MYPVCATSTAAATDANGATASVSCDVFAIDIHQFCHGHLQ
jgi:hypothetical protein